MRFDLDEEKEKDPHQHLIEKISDELETMVYRQRTRRKAFQIGLLLVSVAFLVIAFVADQISAFTEVRLEQDGTRITNNRYCGLMSLYSKDVDIAINPILTNGTQKSWPYNSAKADCVPLVDNDPEALAVCESFKEFNDKLTYYKILVIIALGISFLNLLIHSYRLYIHLKNHDDFNPEEEPLRMWLCAPAKLIYWFECLLYAVASTCLALAVFWFPGFAKDTYCYDKAYTGICEGEYELAQLTCGWQLGSSNFHIMVCGFFQLIGCLIKLKQLLCTHMISYKSRLVFPEKTNSIEMDEVKK
jgi:hypothetical protein